MGGDRIQDDMFTGLDVDKATISVAVAQGKRGGEVRHRGRCRTVPIRFASSWRSWRPVGSGYILAMKQILAATACTGNSPNLGMAASWWPSILPSMASVPVSRCR